MSLEVVESYPVNVVVGSPDKDHRHVGVPQGGPFDQEAVLLAQIPLGFGNEWPVIEAAAPIEFLAQADSYLSVAGAWTTVKTAKQEFRSPCCVAVQKGDTIRVEAPERGARVVIRAGAWEGARSWPIELKVGTVFTQTGNGYPCLLEREPWPESVLRYVAVSDDVLPDRELTVGPDSDRRGVRLYGLDADEMPVIESNLASQPTVFGAIQATPSGVLLIHGPDGPTVGGYPVVGVVAKVDRSRLAQLSVGDNVMMQRMTIDEARTAWLDYWDWQAKRQASIELMLKAR